jgi:hypothetical protein
MSSMCPVVSFVLRVLETVAAHCALPPCYLFEVDRDDHVLAGVEIDIPGDGILTTPQKKIFWTSGWEGYTAAYEQTALQAIKFLQGMYGFIVKDYNYECVVCYRNSGNDVVAVAASVVRYAAYLERALACAFRADPQPPPNLALLYSSLLASLYSFYLRHRLTWRCYTQAFWRLFILFS